jgi:hypothetical protein
MGHGGRKSEQEHNKNRTEQEHHSLVRTTACFVTHTLRTLCCNSTSQTTSRLVISVYQCCAKPLAAQARLATQHIARVDLKRGIIVRSACC